MDRCTIDNTQVLVNIKLVNNVFNTISVFTFGVSTNLKHSISRSKTSMTIDYAVGSPHACA